MQEQGESDSIRLRKGLCKGLCMGKPLFGTRQSCSAPILSLNAFHGNPDGNNHRDHAPRQHQLPGDNRPRLTGNSLKVLPRPTAIDQVCLKDSPSAEGHRGSETLSVNFGLCPENAARQATRFIQGR